MTRTSDGGSQFNERQRPAAWPSNSSQ